MNLITIKIVLHLLKSHSEKLCCLGISVGVFLTKLFSHYLETGSAQVSFQGIWGIQASVQVLVKLGSLPSSIQASKLWPMSEVSGAALGKLLGMNYFVVIGVVVSVVTMMFKLRAGKLISLDHCWFQLRLNLLKKHQGNNLLYMSPCLKGNSFLYVSSVCMISLQETSCAALLINFGPVNKRSSLLSSKGTCVKFWMVHYN